MLQQTTITESRRRDEEDCNSLPREGGLATGTPRPEAKLAEGGTEEESGTRPMCTTWTGEQRAWDTRTLTKADAKHIWPLNPYRRSRRQSKKTHFARGGKLDSATGINFATLRDV